MSDRSAILNESSRRRRGIALILVLLVMAVASILAFAMLSASALQATAGSNAVTAAAAQAQAESGIHLAAYYLTHPNTAIGSELASQEAWASGPVSFLPSQPSTAMPGTVSVTVSYLGGNFYNVIAVGSVPSATDGQPITRTITAELEAISSYQITGAGAFNVANSITIGQGVTITGSPNALSTMGSVQITGTGQANGNVSASSVSGNVNGSTLPVPSAAPAPTSGTITDYSQPYYYQGMLYYPGEVSGTGGTYGSQPSNPLGIYYYQGSLTVTGPMTVNGTLYVKGGSLIDKSTVTINPNASQLTYNLPALVVDQSLEMYGSGNTLTANGVVCTASGITNVLSSSSTTLTINGALLITNTNVTKAINNGSDQVNVTFNSGYTNVLNLVASGPATIKIISWSE